MAVKLYKIHIFKAHLSSSMPDDGIQATEPDPQKGYGKLAIRSMCNYYKGSIGIEIFNVDSNGGNGTEVKSGYLQPLYDSLNKRETTYITELLPGKYNLELRYNHLGKWLKRVNVYEGIASVYMFKRENPYGFGCGQLVLTTDHFSHHWKISIGQYRFDDVKLQKGKGLFLILPKGYYIIKVEKLKPNGQDLDPNSVSKSINIEEGEELVEPIN